MYQLREELAGYNRHLLKAPRPLTLRAAEPGCLAMLLLSRCISRSIYGRDV
jgi:hypothetical protein